MKVYFGSKSNKYYIMCREFDECYSFNMFGTLESKNSSILDCDSWTEVDVLSFVSSGMGSCELLFNGEKAKINSQLLDCVAVIRELCNYLGTMFTISHEDSIGKYTQVVFVTQKGKFTKSMLSERFSIGTWNTLN